MVVAVTPGKYGGLGRGGVVRKPTAAKKTAGRWRGKKKKKKIKGTEEGHKTGTGSPGQEAHHQ